MRESISPCMIDHARDDRRGDPRVFTIPPGAAFLPTFASALLDGTLVPGFSAAVGPLGLVDATIYVPTRRSARALAAAFAVQLGAAGTFLPRILPLGDLEAIETNTLLDPARLTAEDTEPSRPAIEPLARRMIFTRLILSWAKSVRAASVTDDPRNAGEPFVVANTAADAWHLSGELAALLDELNLADLGWRELKDLGTDAFDRHWGITLDFLRIAAEHWPAILAERGQVDPAARQKELIEAEIARLARPSDGSGPVIVAGAIGSDALTTRLIGAIARLPRGAVVLPGLDQHLDEASWAQLSLPEREGHPQAVLQSVLSSLSMPRSDVPALGVVTGPVAARARLVSEALRPAETTEAWIAATALDRDAALRDVALIEAADEREEALALAVALRESLEGSGTAVLVTPDRGLARRVREELMRWGIEIDDSGGEVLSGTAAGALAQMALDCATDDLDPLAALTLLAHPAVCLGRPRQRVDRLTRDAELFLLRGVLPKGVMADPAALVATAKARARDGHAPAALRRVTNEEFAAVESLLQDLVAALEPLRRQTRAALGTWVAAQDEAVAALTRTEAATSALGGVDGTRLAALLADLSRCAEPDLVLDRVAYAGLYRRIASETAVRGPARSHPRLKILGLLEFRLLSADRVLLGGLDETIWPPQVTADAFLNRPMRAALGLLPPERRIGQAAHDLEMALGQPQVIMSRAAKRGGAPTVPSRFLQRLAAISGEASWSACRERGSIYLDHARALDRPNRQITIRRPSPKPPVALRPTELSVTRIETLRRDPYAIYAEKILRLRPLEPVAAEIGPREWGTAFHGVLSAFVGRVRQGPHSPDALADLLHDSQAVFAPLMEEAHTQAFLAPRLHRWVHGFHAWESARRATLDGVHVEAEGRLAIPLDDGSSFDLIAKADRIERRGSGAVSIVDYKTGAAPSKREVLAGFAPQLTLEAAIALGGGFAAFDAVTAIDEAFYVKFGTGSDVDEIQLQWRDRTLADVVAQHLAGLKDLLNTFRDPDTGYMARPYPQFLTRFGDYDHLSRVKEWSATGGVGDPAEEGGA